jgi:NADPH:quinone reductase-like Zn-dependent oxidoreductase
MEAISKATPGDDARTLRRPMRAILQSGYGTADVFRVGITERPTAGVGEVVVRVHAAGLDRGTWHLMTGRPYLMRLMGFGFSAPKNPVPGLDVAGTVVEVGPSVTRFKVGDEVFGIGTGSFAEYARVREDKLASKPSSLSFEQAAVLGVSGGTALQALQHGQLKAGERILIVGASGGVGTFAVQLAKALGAAVTAVCSTSKVETVRSLGADEVIDYRQRDFTVSDAKYDLILDIGGHTPVSRLRRVMTPTGRLVFVGDELGGDWTAGFERQLLAFAIAPFVKQRFMGLMAREHFEELEQLAKMADAGKLAPVIDRECSLAQMVEAMRDLEAGRVCGKVAIKLG